MPGFWAIQNPVSLHIFTLPFCLFCHKRLLHQLASVHPISSGRTEVLRTVCKGDISNMLP